MMTIRMSGLVLAWTMLAAPFSIQGAAAREYDATVVMGLTGAYAFVAVPATNGMKLAEADLKAQGFWGKDSLRVDYKDNRSDKQEAITLLNKVASDNKSLMFIGPVATPEALAVGPAANDQKIVMFSTSTSPDVLKSGPWAFKASESATDFVRPLGEYISRTVKPKSCYVIGIRDNVAYMQYADAFADALKAGSSKVLARDSFASSESDFSALVTKVVSSGADCVAVSATPEPGANFIVQLRQAGLAKDTVVVYLQSAGGAFLKTGGKAVDGTYFVAEFSASSPTPVTDRFIKAYAQRYGVEPDAWAAVGYSMMVVAAHAIRNAAEKAHGMPTREQVRDAMAATKDIPVMVGAKGRLSIDANRVPHFGGMVLRLKDGKPVQP
jgi:branched-chain amino acid transport system substrate-binding protein